MRSRHFMMGLTVLLLPALALAVTITPDQTRSFGTDAQAGSSLCFRAPGGGPIGAIPDGCPGGLAGGPAEFPTGCDPTSTCVLGEPGLGGGLIDSIIEFTNPTPAIGGSCQNYDGDGVVGYINFGPLTAGILICDPLPCPGSINPNNCSVNFDSCSADKGKDYTTIIRFPLPAGPAGGPSSGGGGGAFTAAVLEVSPALPTVAPVFWASLAVSLCDPPPLNLWDNIPDFFDSEVLATAGNATFPCGLNTPADRVPAGNLCGDPSPVDNDCIVSGRDATGDALGQFDVVMNVGEHNPESGRQLGGIASLGFLVGLNTPGSTFQIPLNARALQVINSGGSPPGYFEVAVRMGDKRGADSEGPNSTRALFGFPAGVNLMVIEDREGCTLNNPLHTATTNLVLVP